MSKESWGGSSPDDPTIDIGEELRFRSYKRKQLGSNASGIPPPLLSYADRRSIASSGVELLYLGCPLCGFNRPMYRRDGGIVESRDGRETNRFLALTDKIIQIRKGGGRAIGFFLFGEKNLKDLYSSSNLEYNAVFNNLKEEVIKILDEIERIEQGLI